MSDLIARAVQHFNAEAYRDALIAFEHQWHTDRHDELRALINLSNALNQLRLGLIQGPRANLAIADALLAVAPQRYAGLDLRPVRAYVTQLRGLLPAEDVAVPWEAVPRLRIELTP